jgi:hypothetical protein
MTLCRHQRLFSTPRRAPHKRHGSRPKRCLYARQYRVSTSVLSCLGSFCWIVCFVLCCAEEAKVDNHHTLLGPINDTNSIQYLPRRQQRVENQQWKRRFLTFLERRKAVRRVLKPVRKSPKPSSSSLDVPIITDPSLTYHLHPTSALLIESERRKLVSSSNYHHSTERNGTTNETLDEDDFQYKTWFAPEQNAVYATIPDIADPNHIENRPLQDFYVHRHLSRYERLYRAKHDYDLQYNWNGYYDRKFMDQVVPFDDSATKFKNCTHHWNA